MIHTNQENIEIWQTFIKLFCSFLYFDSSPLPRWWKAHEAHTIMPRSLATMALGNFSKMKWFCQLPLCSWCSCGLYMFSMYVLRGPTCTSLLSFCLGSSFSLFHVHHFCKSVLTPIGPLYLGKPSLTPLHVNSS